MLLGVSRGCSAAVRAESALRAWYGSRHGWKDVERPVRVRKQLR